MRGWPRRPRGIGVWAGGLSLLFAPFAPAAAAGDDPKDFPPLQAPGRPAPAAPSAPPETTPETPAPTPAPTPAGGDELEAYRLGVGDEVEVAVLAQPTLSGIVKVRPDGALTTPGAGTIHALGRTPEEVGREIEEKLASILRHPHVDLVVTNFGEQRVFVMGEVNQPGDKPFYKGVTALQAIAQCGGVLPTGKHGSVLVLRRTGSEEMELHRLDLSGALEGEGVGQDLRLRPYDIVYVPKTFIAGLNDFVDQYFRRMVPPFTLYLEGWKAFNVGSSSIRYVATP